MYIGSLYKPIREITWCLIIEAFVYHYGIFQKKIGLLKCENKNDSNFK